MNEGAKLMQYVEVCLGFFGHGAMHELQPTETMKDVPHILCVYIPKNTTCALYWLWFLLHIVHMLYLSKFSGYISSL